MLVESFSGIRGLYGTDLTKDTVRRYAYVYAKWLKEKFKNKKLKVVIGSDTRPSSNELKKSIINIISHSIDVIDVGFNTTPAVEMAVRIYSTDGGIMITASHNEPEWNGFKFLSNDGSMLKPSDSDEIIASFRKTRDLFLPAKKNKVIDKSKDLINKYVDFVLSFIKDKQTIKKSKLKVVVDPNGGAASVVVEKLLKKLGVEVICVNMALGRFKRPVEPNEYSLSYLQKIIKENDADLGAGFDCDGDRMEIVLPNQGGFVKSHGFVVSGHYVLALLIDEILDSKRKENEIVVTNDATSSVVRRIAEKYNAKIVEVEVGETNVVEEMKRLEATIGGEGSSSGGIVWPSRCRDGILTLAFILKLIAEKRKPLSEILERYPQYFTMAEKIKFKTVKFSIKDKLKSRLLKLGYETQETGNETGGIKWITDDSFCWFRQSKTEEGVFRIIADAPNKAKCEQLLKEGIRIFGEVLK